VELRANGGNIYALAGNTEGVIKATGIANKGGRIFLTAEGGSGGALALAVADRVLMLENAYYSVISPEGCATILFKDAAAAPRAAAALRMTAIDLLRLGVMDAIVPEPEAGAHTDPTGVGANLKAAIVASLAELLPLSSEELLTRRYDRFRMFGTPGRQPVLAPIEEAT